VIAVVGYNDVTVRGEGDANGGIQMLRARSRTLAASDGGAVPTASGWAPLYPVIVHVAHDDVTVWGENDADGLGQLLRARSRTLAAGHGGAVPTASGGAALYPVIAVVGYNDVTVRGEGDANGGIQMLRARSRTLAASDGGAVPTASGWAPLYPVIQAVGHNDVTVRGQGEVSWVIQLPHARSRTLAPDHGRAIPFTTCGALLYAVIGSIRHDVS